MHFTQNLGMHSQILNPHLYRFRKTSKEVSEISISHSMKTAVFWDVALYNLVLAVAGISETSVDLYYTTRCYYREDGSHIHAKQLS
jgi:hypothetical protein